MRHPALRVAQGLAHFREQVATGSMSRARLLDEVDVPLATFRSAAQALGARKSEPGVRFFDASTAGRLTFGPGAGLTLGVSIGASSLRAALVDAHGVVIDQDEEPASYGQLEERPEELLKRVRGLGAKILDRAFRGDDRLVDGKLPLLGVAVAWPCPLNRQGRPEGYALRHSRWKEKNLSIHLSRSLGLDEARCHSLNAAWAAAIAVAADRTSPGAIEEFPHPRLTMVLRLAGGIGGAIVVIEPPTLQLGEGARLDGFTSSILLGGMNTHAGEIGHTMLWRGQIDRLNKDTPAELNLGQIEAGHCSCIPPEDQELRRWHLEAVAAAPSVAARIDPGREIADVMTELVRNPGPRHEHALKDLAAMLAHALRGPIAILDPAEVVLTGAMAVETVRSELQTYLQSTEVFSAAPKVTRLEGDENEYVRARGAALAVVRGQLYRRLDYLVGESSAELREKRVREHTTLVERGVWSAAE